LNGFARMGFLEAIREIAAGISDDEVLARANVAQAILISEDKDFGELALESSFAQARAQTSSMRKPQFRERPVIQHAKPERIS
jgi:hypothetical protein